MSNCAKLQADIQALQNNIERDTVLSLNDGRLRDKLVYDKASLESKRKAFKDLNCELVLAEQKAEKVLGIADTFSEYDKLRIESESIYQRNKKVFFSSVVLIGALLLIWGFSQKKLK